MKVKELKEKLEKLDDDMEIHVQESFADDEFMVIGEVKVLMGLTSGQSFYYIEGKKQ